MSYVTLDERMAIRNAATMADAQWAYDNAAEPDGHDDIDERLCAIDAAEEFLAKARAELCNVRPTLLRVDGLMADAMRCLMVDA